MVALTKLNDTYIKEILIKVQSASVGCFFIVSVIGVQACSPKTHAKIPEICLFYQLIFAENWNIIVIVIILSIKE